MIKINLAMFLILIISSKSITQNLVWKHLGGPMGGVVGDVAINSKGEIYAGVYSDWEPYSGLYKSTNNGDSWNKIETQFKDFEVYAIYITKEDHIWVGTNWQGRIYLSTNNGQTWENKRNGYNSGECWAFGQSKDGILFAGDGQYVKIFRSTDYGENWTLSANLRPLVFATDSNNIVYAGTHDGLFATRDSGKTWAQNNFLKNFPVSSILIDSNNNIFCGTGYYSNGDGVFYSTDGGQNWIQLGLAGKVVLSLAFDSEGSLYAGTKKDGLFKSTNMGQTWTQHENGLYRKEVFRLKLNNQNDIFIGSENEGVFRSTNGGKLFDHIGLPISRIKNIVFGGDSLIFASTPSGVQKFNLIKKKWTNLGLQNVEAVTITPSNHLYAGTYYEGLYKSTDLGKTWESINLTIDTLMSVYNVLAVNDDTIFASTEYNLRWSTNGGFSWDITKIRTGFFSRSLFLENNTLWTTGYGPYGVPSSIILFKSNDFGLSFDSLLSGFDLSYNNNPICAIDNGKVFFAAGDPLRCIFKSSNYGLTWQKSLSNKFIYTVFADEDGVVMTGDFDSLYLSTDFGESWSSFIQPRYFENYILDIKRDKFGKFYVATRSGGLYELDVITDVKEYPENIPGIFYLFQNYPNPFNPNTTMNFQIPSKSHVTLKVFDILGREVATLVNEEKSPGNYSVNFDGTKLSSGAYFYELKANEIRLSKKMILLR